MPGLIIDRKEYSIPGMEIVNYHDHRNLKLKPKEDMRARRTRWVRSIFLHNTKNIETVVLSGIGANTSLEDRISRLWSTDARSAGAHLSVDWDCTVGCHADLLLDAAYHGGQVNEVSIGMEIYEDGKGRVYSAQLATVVHLVKWLCAFFGIQQQMPPASSSSVIPRLLAGGSDCVGVFGHCHAYAGKPSDPGRSIFKALSAVGFREFSWLPVSSSPGQHACDDELFWFKVQAKLGLKQTGIPDAATCDALRAAGYKDGLWLPPEEEEAGEG